MLLCSTLRHGYLFHSFERCQVFQLPLKSVSGHFLSLRKEIKELKLSFFFKIHRVPKFFQSFVALQSVTLLFKIIKYRRIFDAGTNWR